MLVVHAARSSCGSEALGVRRSHNTHCGALRPLHPSLSTFLLPMAAGSKPQPGHEGSEEAGGWADPYGLRVPLCCRFPLTLSQLGSKLRQAGAAPQHYRQGRRRERCWGICSSSSPVLQGRGCAQQGSLPSVYGRSSKAVPGEGEKRRGVGESPFANRV